MNTTKQTERRQKQESELEVLVVGAGIAGLAFAINAQLSGFTVKVIEKRGNLQDFGDGLGLQPSCLHTMKKWPGFFQQLQAISYGSTVKFYNKFDGRFLQELQLGKKEESVGVLRSTFHQLLHHYCTELGVDVELSKSVVNYFESNDRAGVNLADGSSMTADIVVAADGVASASWTLVVGAKQKPFKSGSSVYRANIPVRPLLDRKDFQELFGDSGHAVAGFVGTDSYIIISKSPERLSFMLNHIDLDDSDDRSRTNVPREEPIKLVSDWHPVIQEIVKSVPDGEIVDWKLLLKDPSPNWVSPLGRVVQIGDAAHMFLPTSAYGASMAIEDAHSLNECLRHVNKENVQLATRVHNKLRFERTSAAQDIGLKNRELFHNVNHDDPDGPPDLTKHWGSWLTEHDAEEYAKVNFESCAQHVQSGSPFKNTNAIPVQ